MTPNAMRSVHPSLPMSGTLGLLAAILILLVTTSALHADPQKGKRVATGERCYTLADGSGKQVCLPQGALSFADAVVDYDTGNPAPDPAMIDPERALGPPDWRYDGDGSDHSLGCGGYLVLRFTDNALVDVPGIDLYVFEVGGQMEASSLAISADGRHWIDIGVIRGSTRGVDIAGKAQPQKRYLFVRLTDNNDGCGGYSAGADIDAVAAIGVPLPMVSDPAVQAAGKEAAGAAGETTRQTRAMEKHGPADESGKPDCPQGTRECCESIEAYNERISQCEAERDAILRQYEQASAHVDALRHKTYQSPEEEKRVRDAARAEVMSLLDKAQAANNRCGEMMAQRSALRQSAACKEPPAKVEVPASSTKDSKPCPCCNGKKELSMDSYFPATQRDHFDDETLSAWSRIFSAWVRIHKALQTSDKDAYETAVLDLRQAADDLCNRLRERLETLAILDKAGVTDERAMAAEYDALRNMREVCRTANRMVRETPLMDQDPAEWGPRAGCPCCR